MKLNLNYKKRFLEILLAIAMVAVLIMILWANDFPPNVWPVIDQMLNIKRA